MRRFLSVVWILLIAVAAAALERQANADYRARREALSKKASGVVVIFGGTEASTGDAIYGFRQDDNYYYLTGLGEPAGAVLVASAQEAKNGQPARPYTEILFLPPHNYVQERWTGPKLGPGDANLATETGFERVLPLDRLPEELGRQMADPAQRATLYMNLNPATNSIMEWLRRTNSAGIAKDAGPLLATLRMVKDAGELALIRKATDASVAAHLAAAKAMRPGVSEREIAAVMQYEFQRRGCERPAYAPIVGAGFNSTVLHYSESSGTVKNGDVVVMDVGGEYSMYATDITRTLPASGKFTPRQREIYDVVLGAQEAAQRAFQAGKSTLGRQTPDSLYKIAYDYINTHGRDQHGQPLGKYFIHGLGHHVGLNVHDASDANAVLDKGMVFTIEPGIYIPEESLGVRIEDTFYVDDSGKLASLSGSLPRSAQDVERLMAK